ncbi:MULTISPECIES: HNH endonuclease signature motif containing protein [Microbacterium]|uniref:HNH endonuclease signature motif containing protein n=1 Tax=Microbacterium TaxID=33882 RepID=UPI000D6468BB|nr:MULTISPECIES: HNH endonuclease signature motif containing protein [Microbacterium]
MDIFSDMRAALDALRTALGESEPTSIPAAVQRLEDDVLLTVIENATTLVRTAECVRIAASGVVAARSTREAGHGGLAQKRGHRSAVSLIQDLTGSTRADATKQVRIGEALAAASVSAAPVDPTAPGTGLLESIAPAVPPQPPWHAALGEALMSGALTSAQHDAIFRGLGTPPTIAHSDAEDPAARDAWTMAAEQLIDEAQVRTVEELATAARAVRDLLDPDGAQRRFDERFEARSFRTWTDRDGVRRGSFTFDDVGAVGIETIIGTTLRPRRGGPRFVDPDEAARAQELQDDPRTNDQLAYDLVMDIIRAGALADAQTVFGTRQAGIRVVATRAAHDDALHGRPTVALVEDTGAPLPGWVIGTRACDVGATTVTLDSAGNPLDVGREARLFTPKQRIALAIRDGGCRIPACDRPASYCEAHHVDPFAHGGRTDIDRGVLLCPFHHMNLHHHGWRITRKGKDDFILHRPGIPPTRLPARIARRYDFGDLRPPPRRLIAGYS